MATQSNTNLASAPGRAELEPPSGIELLELEPARQLWAKWLLLVDEWQGYADAHAADADELERQGRRGVKGARARASWCAARAARARVYVARFQARIDMLTGASS